MTEDKKKALETLERIKAPLDTILLDDISRGVKELINKLAAQVPEGVSDQAVVAVAGLTPIAMVPSSTDPPWFSATIFNDGPDPVYISLNEPHNPSERHAALNMGDSYVINTIEAKIKSLWFANMNPTDTSSCRVQLLQ